MKKVMTIGLVLVTAISLVACKNDTQVSKSEEDNSKIVLEYGLLKSESADLELKKGDLLGIDVKGKANIKIIKNDDKKVIYEGENLLTSSFSVAGIESDGDYNIAVNGKRLMGSVTVNVISGEKAEKMTKEEQNFLKDAEELDELKNELN